VNSAAIEKNKLQKLRRIDGSLKEIIECLNALRI